MRTRDNDLAKEIVRGNMVPRSYPPLSEIALSDDGDAWVTVRSGPDGTRAATVITKGGRQVGMFPLAKTSSVRWVGETEALVVEEDGDGLQDLVLYRIKG